MDIKEYAQKILEDSGCDQYTYGGRFSEYILDDLKEGFPDGMEFPYIDVANAILEMSRPAPIYKAPYKVYWENEHSCDAYDAKSFEEAKEEALSTLELWMEEVDDMEDWDYMIYNCSVEVKKYNPMTDEYEECWEPSYEDEKEIGWEPYDKLKSREDDFIDDIIEED